MKLHFLILLWITLGTTVLRADLVYEVPVGQHADKRVFVTQNRQEADVIIYRTTHRQEARGSRYVWFMEPNIQAADWRCRFVSNRQSADFVVFFTNNRQEIGKR